jgi:beta-lactamase superfamily II metal-dependent hydrolase
MRKILRKTCSALLLSLLSACSIFRPGSDTPPGETPPQPRTVNVVDTFAKVNPHDVMIVHVIDSAQGNCQLIECPKDLPIMVDCGAATSGRFQDREKLGKYINAYIVNALSNYIDNGVIQFRALVLSHADVDHYNLIPHALPQDTNVTPRFKFDNLLYTGTESQFTASDMSTYFTTAKNNGAKVFQPSANQKIYFTPPTSLPLKTWPAESVLQCGNASKGQFASILMMNAGSNKNAGSLVVRLQNGWKSMLLSGDAEDKTYAAIYQAYGLMGDQNGTPDSTMLNVSVLVSAHHGAETHNSNSGSWAYMSNPSSVIFPAGQHQGFAHPRCNSFDVYQTNTGWKNYIQNELLNCSNNGCRTLLGQRNSYKQNIINTGTQHDLTCGVASSVWSTKQLKESIYNIQDVGTVQVIMPSSQNLFYWFFCPESQKLNPPADSCLHPRQ